MTPNVSSRPLVTRGLNVKEYLVSDGSYTRHEWAESPEEAALLASHGWSISHLRVGVTLDVIPLNEAWRYRVQYERPNAPPLGDNERLGNYGNPIIVSDFQRISR
jgi:hypothetical protein